MLNTEAHCSFFFSGFQAHLILFCSCENCQLAKRRKNQIKGLYENSWFKGEIMNHNNGIELVLL